MQLSQNKNCESLLAVIVLYKCRLEQSKSIESLSIALETISENLDLYVFDNSPIQQYECSKFTYNKFNIIYQSDNSNPGLSKAYNEGARFAIKNGKKWILLLDQDTVFSNDFFYKLNKSIQKFGDHIKLFAPILKLTDDKYFSPCIYKFKRGFHVKNIPHGITSLNKYTPVNSGITVDLKAYFKVNGYNEFVKLDFSDFEFIERFKKKFDEFYVLDSIGYQEFSNEVGTKDAAIKRFEFYCNGALNSNRSSQIDSFYFFVITLMRMMKLMIKWKSLQFVKTWFRFYINAKKG